MVKIKKTPYMEIGDDISGATAYVQATRALDVAAFIAEQRQDVDNLISIAQTYVAIAERLSPHFEDDDEEEGGRPFGFSTVAIAEIQHDPLADAEDCDDEEEDDEVSDRVQP